MLPDRKPDRVFMISDLELAELRYPAMQVPYILRDRGFNIEVKGILFVEATFTSYTVITYDPEKMTRTFRQWDEPRCRWKVST